MADMIHTLVIELVNMLVDQGIEDVFPILRVSTMRKVRNKRRWCDTAGWLMPSTRQRSPTQSSVCANNPTIRTRLDRRAP